MQNFEDEFIDGIIEMLFGDMPVTVVSPNKESFKKATDEIKKNSTSKKCECNKSCNKTTYRPTLTNLIDHIVSQDTAVIVFWKDGTKTSAKCGPEDKFDYEKGLSMAILKYVFGNKVYQNDMTALIKEYPHTTFKKPTKKKTTKVEKKPESKSTVKTVKTTTKTVKSKASKN